MFRLCCGANTKSAGINTNASVSKPSKAAAVVVPPKSAPVPAPVPLQAPDSSPPPRTPVVLANTPSAVVATDTATVVKAPDTVIVTAHTSPNPEEEEEMSAEVFAILKNIQERLSNIEAGMGKNSSSSQPAQSNGTSDVPQSIKAFDQYSATYLNPFVAACKKLGGDALTGGTLLCEAWGELRTFLVISTACKEPAQAKFPALLAGLAAKTKALSDSVKRNEWEKHMKTLVEGVQSLNWVMVKPAPCDFIISYADGAEYWANNIRKEYRTTSPDQMEFCNTFKALMLELAKYVKEFHTSGVTWNSKGIDVDAYSGAAAPVTAKAPSTAAATATAAPKPQGADLFAALNKGGNITSGLKTVTKDMQTWRAEYKGNDPHERYAAAVAPAVPVTAKGAPVAAVKGPPKFEFQNAGSKWLVENQTDKNGVIEVKITEMKETVYIYGCAGATIDIKGKCKSIVVDGCKKTQVLFDTAMASCEVINCQRMQIQCREKVAAVAIDKTDGIIVFLPTTSLDTEIVASKSSEMNLSWPDSNGDMVERPIPEQYKHHIKGLGITADVSDLYTH